MLINEHQNANINTNCLQCFIIFIGSSGVDNWHVDRFKCAFEESHIFVMTPQILFDILSKNIVNISCFNLLVFDEVHHGTKDHPYKKIMDFYHEDRFSLPQCRLPKILGLTATIIKHTLDTGPKLEKELRQLEQSFDSKIITVDDILKVENYGTRPDCLILSYRDIPSHYTDDYFKDKITDFHEFLAHHKNSTVEECFGLQFGTEQVLLEDACIAKSLKDFKSLSTNIIDILVNIGPWAANKLAHIIINRIDDLYPSIDANYIQAAAINLNTLLKIYTRQVSAERLLDPTVHITDKCCKLVEIFEEIAPSNEFSAIVFVKKRLTSYVLSKYFNELKNLNPKLASIRCHHFTGQSSSYSSIIPDEYISIKKQKLIISQFHEGN